MAQVKSARFTKEQEEAMEDMVERGMADNSSEAHRMLVNAGMREYGYENGEYTDTFLKLAVNRIGWLFGIAGLVGLAFTLTYPVPTRMPAFALVIVSFLCFAMYGVLDAKEPGVTRWLSGLLGGETA